MMNYTFDFPIAMGVILIVLVFLDLKHDMLRDTSLAVKKPFSFSKVQLAFWFVIIAAAFTSIILAGTAHDIPTFANSTLILLGISVGTHTAARLIDIADQKNVLIRSQDTESQGFFLDILSDNDGVNLHRFQCLIFNLVIGSWFVFRTFTNLGLIGKMNIDLIIPDLSNNNLFLLGISAGTYVALKANENKLQTSISVLPVNLVPAPAPVSASAPAADDDVDPVLILQTPASVGTSANAITAEG